MLLYFPKEIKEKRKENELEQATMDRQQNVKRTLTPRRSGTTINHRVLTPPPRESSCNIM